MQCATHPKTETNLKCGKCGKPICPACLVQTPVGARCRECSRLYTMPTYRLTPQYYLRATVSGLLAAAVLAFPWLLLDWLIPVILLEALVGAGAGFLIGEVISRAVNRKRGRLLVVIGSLAVLGCYGLRFAVIFALPLITPRFSLFDLLGIALGIYLAVKKLS
ncbi:hypothetical protein ACFLTW_04645 [Chloroflexota bacterium]